MEQNIILQLVKNRCVSASIWEDLSMKHGLASVLASSAKASGSTSGVDGAPGQYALLAGSQGKYSAAN